MLLEIIDESNDQNGIDYCFKVAWENNLSTWLFYCLKFVKKEGSNLLF